jgi:hypothetical protein
LTPTPKSLEPNLTALSASNPPIFHGGRCPPGRPLDSVETRDEGLGIFGAGVAVS